MLPFLRKQQEASVVTDQDPVIRKSDNPEESDGGDRAFVIAVREIFRATTDEQKAEAFRAALDLYESEPHFEN